MKLVYPAYFSPLEEQDGYCVTFPDLSGAVTQGNSLAEAIENASDCACGWIFDELDDGNVPPKASNLGDISIENEGDFVNLVALDMDKYADKYSENGSQTRIAHC